MILGLPENHPKSTVRRQKKAASSGTGTSRSKNNPYQPMSGSDDGLTRHDNLWQDHWPPFGWPMFENVTQPKAISTKKCPETGIVHGASYNISITPADNKDQPTLYTLEIQRWSYDGLGHHNGSTPILLKFKNCPQSTHNHNDEFSPCFQEMRLFGEPKHPQTNTETNNFALVSAYLISRIDKGLVPDIKRVLKLYKLL